MNKKQILLLFLFIIVIITAFITYARTTNFSPNISMPKSRKAPATTPYYTNEQPTPPANTINKNKFTQNEKYCEKDEDCAPTGCCNNYCHNIFNPIDDMCEKTCSSIAICKCTNNQCVKTDTKRVPEY